MIPLRIKEKGKKKNKRGKKARQKRRLTNKYAYPE